MATTEMNCLASGGVTLNPTIADYKCTTRNSSGMWTYTIDPTKSYILTVGNRYNGSPYATNVYSIIKGTFTDANNIPSSTTGTTASLVGNVLSVIGTSTASSYHDITLVQLD